MASVKDALMALNITEWTMTGEPSSETEFNNSFKCLSVSFEQLIRKLIFSIHCLQSFF